MTVFKNKAEKEVNTKPRIIVFEGVDGTGKSTSIKLASKFLAKLGIEHIVTQELAGSQMQMRFRQMLMESESPIDELLVMSLARRWHYKHILLPALQKGKHILLDRFISSTWAYQGQYIKPHLMEIFEKQIWEVPAADLTVYLSGESLRQQQRDRFERKEEDFFNKARKIYENRAALALRHIRASELRFEEENENKKDMDIYESCQYVGNAESRDGGGHHQRSNAESRDGGGHHQRSNAESRDGRDHQTTNQKKDDRHHQTDEIAALYISIPIGSWLSVKAGQQWAINRAILSLITNEV